MLEMTVLATVILAASLTPGPPPVPATVAAQTPAAAASVTPAQLAPFLGEWTLDMQGPNGPAAFTLTVKSENDKPAADIASEQMPKQAISDFSISDKSLTLGYSFTYEGNPVSAVIYLTPDEKGPMKAQIDFAGGAYVMNGTAKKKEAPKLVE
jgi:hypothetical protein